MTEEIYIVGGYVRDKLLGIQSKDIDFCFVSYIENISLDDGYQQMKRWIQKEDYKIFLEVPSMVTIRANIKNMDNNKFGSTTADFVLARKEISYSDNSRHPELTIGTLFDDLARRDFTINAMAEDLNGNLYDFFGGAEDIKNKILRTPLNPYKTLLDDPLRLLRALRFSITKEFIICDELLNAMSDEKILDKLFNVVSTDRIREELYKMFSYSTPKTIHLLTEIDAKIPNFINRLFSNGLWLKPTNKSK
jgi:tRNA nucleotidyltransferase/poly(A) polymerase